MGLRGFGVLVGVGVCEARGIEQNVSVVLELLKPGSLEVLNEP